MEEKIRSWSELPKNWDDYGGMAPTPQTCENAVRCLHQWQAATKDIISHPLHPAPGGDGSIALESWKGPRSFTFWFAKDDDKETCSYLCSEKVVGRKLEFPHEGDFDELSEALAVTIAKWLLTGEWT